MQKMRKFLPGRIYQGDIVKNIKNEYDVVVVGAGPSGSLAAREAAKNGSSVLLIEKRQEIGDPVRCAEGIGYPRVSDYIKFSEKSICTEIRKSTIVAPDGTELKLGSSDPNMKGYILERKIFDRELANEASKAGAEVRVKTSATGLIIENGQVCGVRVRHLDSEQEIRCKVVIGADGVESKVGRWAGLDTTLPLKNVESCVQYLVSEIQVNQDEIKIYMGNDIAPGGYLWIFPKGGNKANIGIGLLGSRVRENARPIDYLNKFIEKKFPEGKILEMHFGGVPVSGQMDKFYGNGFMLVGDAARLVDPVTGGGIATAIISGYLAGQRAAQAVKVGDFSEKFFKQYQKSWEKEFKKEFKRNIILKEYALSLSDEEANKKAHELENIDLSDSMNLEVFLKVLAKVDKVLLLKLGATFLNL